MTVMWLSCDFTDTPPRQASGRTEEETVPVEARGNEKRRKEGGREGKREKIFKFLASSLPLLSFTITANRVLFQSNFDDFTPSVFLP